MSTARSIIKSAMRKIGALVKNEEPTADEAVDGLEILNDLLASLSNDSLIVYSRTMEGFTLSGGTASYTIGSGATFNTSRPIRLVSAYVRSGSVDYPLSIVSDEQFATIPYKTTAGIPEFLNYSNAFPQATIKLYPVPATAYTLYLVTEKPLSSFALIDEVSLPEGWRRMLVYNLAIEFASEYGQPVPPEVVKIAAESKGELKKSVMVAKPMQWESGLGESGNIYTGF